MVVILMGVSGSGKTTIGRMLARESGWLFYEGDDLHPQANIEKMTKGDPLDDRDREPWLRSLRELILRLVNASRDAVIACSALKQAYRDYLLAGNRNVRFVFLKGDYDLIEKRLKERTDHFMESDLLQSQFAALEEPAGALVVDVRQEPEAIVALIERSLGAPD